VPRLDSTSSRRAWPLGEEERLLDQAIEYLTKATGTKPLGYRAPSWAFSDVTLDLIQKKGFLYDSSLQALDEPYEIVSRASRPASSNWRSTGR
jgi:peptidoglycan/xylan/chitin deacetylase (PgdA/CDA1 family)